jgi:fluoride exporter
VPYGLTRFLLVCIGGAAGSGLRYLFGGLALRLLGAGFPWGTLGVNVIGSFLMVLIMQLGLHKGLMSLELRLLLTTGVMGGFTTYSAFSYETLHFFQQRAYGLGLLYMAATLIGCLLAALLALLVAR